MPVIKRYANRKLYDTDARRYVTLDGIADLVRRGEAVRVLDHESGLDLTAQIQAQIILAQEKKLRGGLPSHVLTGLIRAGSDTLQQLRHAVAPALEWHGQVDREIERRLLALEHHGDLDGAESARLKALLQTAADLPVDANWPDEDSLRRVLRARGVPSRAALRELARQVQLLTEHLDGLAAQAQRVSQPPSRRARRLSR